MLKMITYSVDCVLKNYLFSLIIMCISRKLTANNDYFVKLKISFIQYLFQQHFVVECLSVYKLLKL
jgi:hypothetical protein